MCESVYANVCARVPACICVPAYAYMDALLHRSMNTQKCRGTTVHKHIGESMCVCVRLGACMCAFLCVYVQVCVTRHVFVYMLLCFMIRHAQHKCKRICLSLISTRVCMDMFFKFH